MSKFAIAFVEDQSPATLRDLVIHLRKAEDADATLEVLSLKIPNLFVQLRDKFMVKSQRAAGGREQQEVHSQALAFSAELVAYVLLKNSSCSAELEALLSNTFSNGFDFVAHVFYPLIGSKMDLHVSTGVLVLQSLARHVPAFLIRNINWSWEPLTRISSMRRSTPLGVPRDLFLSFLSAMLEFTELVPDILKIRSLASQGIRCLDSENSVCFLQALKDRVVRNAAIPRVSKSAFFDAWVLHALAVKSSASCGKDIVIHLISKKSNHCILHTGEKSEALLLDFLKPIKVSHGTELVEAALYGRPELSRKYFQNQNLSLAKKSQLKWLMTVRGYSRIVTDSGVFSKAELGKIVGASEGLLSQLWGLRLLRTVVSESSTALPDLSYLFSLLPPLITGPTTVEKFLVLEELGLVFFAYRQKAPTAWRSFRFDWGSKLLDLADKSESPEIQTSLVKISSRLIAGRLLDSAVVGWVLRCFAFPDAVWIPVLEACGVFREDEVGVWFKEFRKNSLVRDWFARILKLVSENPLNFLREDEDCTKIFSVAAEEAAGDFREVVDRVEKRLRKRETKRLKSVAEVPVVDHPERPQTVHRDGLSEAIAALAVTRDLRSYLLDHAQALILGLGSSDDRKRQAAFNSCAELTARVFEEEETENNRFAFREVPQIALVLRTLRQSIPEPTTEAIPAPVSMIALSFAVASVFVFLKAEHVAYKVVSKFWTLTGSIDRRTIPCWEECFYDSSADARQLRLWLLRVIAKAAADPKSVPVVLQYLDAMMEMASCTVCDRGTVALVVSIVTNLIKAHSEGLLDIQGFVRRFGIVSFLQGIAKSKHLRDDDQ